MFWLASRASRRLLKPSVSLFAVSSCHLTTDTANPYPNFYQNAGLLGPFNQRHRCTPSCVEFDLRLGCDGAKVDASWIDLYFPRQAGPYAKLARLDRPVIFTCNFLIRFPRCIALFAEFTCFVFWHYVDPPVVLPLYFSGVCWTLVYATIYAHQDKEDDLKVGVKSTALRFADSTEEWITGFGIMCMSSLALGGYTAEIGGPYYAFLSAASGQLAWQIRTADISSWADCNRNCVSSNGNQLLGKWFGAIIFSGIPFRRLSSQG
ncbi:unnamed protein product [Malus baccata var. baccata]